MTWSETHQRWQALRAVEAAADADPTGALPWKTEYAALFGSRDGLLAALTYRWDVLHQAQLDPSLPEAVLDDRRSGLVREHAGLLRVLRRHARHQVHDDDCHLAPAC